MIGIKTNAREPSFIRNPGGLVVNIFYNCYSEIPFHGVSSYIKEVNIFLMSEN